MLLKGFRKNCGCVTSACSCSFMSSLVYLEIPPWPRAASAAPLALSVFLSVEGALVQNKHTRQLSWYRKAHGCCWHTWHQRNLVWFLATVTSSQENNFFFLHLITPSFQGRNFIIPLMGGKAISKCLWQVDRKVAIGCQSRRNKKKTLQGFKKNKNFSTCVLWSSTYSSSLSTVRVDDSAAIPAVRREMRSQKEPLAMSVVKHRE